ncbi:MAG: hypothetical protein EP297_13875 [Gammaproteobacteria bacterium]|nr:MAG: hypothetical protein EP297_13875 [Gammaproteobacteria bacterium]
MHCPKCNTIQSDSNTICEGCGLIFAKYQARQQDQQYTEDLVAQYHQQHELHHIDPKGWSYLGIGLVLGLILFFLDFWIIRATIGALITLVHELGHTVLSWLFGSPAMPAFDFIHGGGMTFSFEQQTEILFVIYAALAWLMFRYLRNGLTLVILIVFTVTYTILAFSRLGEVVMLFMGHGTELVIAGVFIYRGISNSAIVHDIERPLYSVIGFYMIFHDIAFAWKLGHSQSYRIEYESQKGGYHFGDFSRIAEQHLGVDLTVTAGFFFFCCLLTPVIAFLAWRYQETWSDWIYARIQREP